MAVDADSNAAGLYLADRGYRVPLAADPAFPGVLRAICRAEGVAALVPLVDEELLPVARLAAEEGIALIAPQSGLYSPVSRQVRVDAASGRCRAAGTGDSLARRRLGRDAIPTDPQTAHRTRQPRGSCLCHAG